MTTLSSVTAAHADPTPPTLSTALQRDLGLTKAQVTARLAQEAKAVQTERSARTHLGDSFAGAWFDPRTGKLVVLTTGATIQLAGADVRTAARSERDLLALKDGIDRLGKAPAGVASWSVDVRTNDVVVKVVDSAAGTEDFVARARKLSPAVRVERTTQVPKPFAEVYGGLPYYIEDAWRCSIGLAVHGGFVTAGHCGQRGHRTTNDNGEELGHVEQSIFPGRDMGFVRTNDNVELKPLVYGYDGYAYYVQGSEEAPIGASVCRSGSTTGMHCGEIRTKHETINYAEGAVHDMTGTSVCAEGGDSGGSWLSGNQAQGVTSGGYGNCTSGGATWFQPLDPILDEWGLTLLTA